MKVLGIDLSTHVGWSVFREVDDPKPLFGTTHLPKAHVDDIAARTLALRVWLRDMITVHRPDVVAFEAPITMAPSTGGGAFTMASTIRLMISLASEAETTAKECGCRVLEVATSSAKIALTGTARLGKDKKNAMIVAATRRGWAVADSHQADAGAVCLVAMEHLTTS